MATHSYVVAKYIPDIVKNEPVNVGILVQSGEKTIEGRFIENFRPLAMRYKDVNIKALKGILDSSRGVSDVKSGDHLKKLEADNQYHLIFSEPNGIVAGTTRQALDKLYDMFISIEPRRTTLHRAMSRIQLQSMMSNEIKKTLQKKWVIRKHRVKGPKDHFAFDYAFKNGHVSDLLHTISFAGDAKRGLTSAKALALTWEYANQENEDLTCAALITPPKDDKNEREYFEPAIAYLKDQECAIKTVDEIPKYVMTIKKKLSKREH